MPTVQVAEMERPLPRLPLEPDLFGRVLWDYFSEKSSEYYLRRDDNYLERDTSARYFRTWEQMPAHHRCLLSHARGVVLDLGAGAGQHTLALQQHGLMVTAVDASPLAIALCRARGVHDACVLNAQALDLPDGSVDSVLLMGNNLGLAGTPEGLRALLLRLHAIVRPGGQILTDTRGYAALPDPSRLRYARWNMTRGRYVGSIRQRVEYDGKRGPEFDWLQIPPTELRDLCRQTGWRIARCVQVDDGVTFAICIGREG